MPSIVQILRTRQQRRKKYSNTLFKRASLGCALLPSLALAALFIWSSNTYAALTRDLPSLATIPQLLEYPNGLLLQPTRFYDRSGEIVLLELENPAISERQYLPLEKDSYNEDTIPRYFAAATLAVSDPSFWDHPGFLMPIVTPQENKTLTQSLVSELLLWDESDSPWRIWRERLLASQLTQQYGREKILTWYLNSANYGNQAYGVDAAAQVYFGKSATELSLAEITMIAAIADAPTFNPINDRDTAIERQRAAIEAMLAQGRITAAEARQAINTEIVFNPITPTISNPAPAFTQLAWEQIATQIPIERLERGGFKIITTLDYDLQIQAACAAEVHLTRLNGLDHASGSSNCQAARFLPTLSFDSAIAERELHANIIIVDPHTGQVLAAVGESATGLNPTLKPGHPPGTLITPFIYLTAFTRGFSPASLVWDIPSSFPDSIIETTNPNSIFDGPMRVRTALTNDIWLPALATLNQIGPENIWQTAAQFGLAIPPDIATTPACASCQFVLGGGEATLLSMTQAFGIFANRGNFTGNITIAEFKTPQLTGITIQEVKDTQGNIWLPAKDPENQPVISSQLAYLMTHMLSDEPARWPSLGHPNPLEIGRPAAAKMGETAQGDDIWTLGYTPQFVVGVWIGTASAGTAEDVALPPKAAAALWHAVIKYATRDLPTAAWEVPPGVTSIDVCDPSGMLPTRDCPLIVNEIFLSGHEPTQLDTLYRAYQVNRETGRLATVFTPPELIEERIYLVVPPDAMSWAQESGFPTPPQSYDAIHAPTPPPDAQITLPTMFNAVAGEVVIEGSASGNEFVSYRLQVGEGLNPKSWFVIGDDIATPVEHDVLGIWDTSSLNGLYAIQLIVVREQQHVDTTTIQVTVDNKAPKVSITYPEDGQVFSSQTYNTITFQVQATDNLQIEQVSFYIDEQLTATQNQPPFALPWATRIGKHRLRLVATDLAGNTHQYEVVFTVE